MQAHFGLGGLQAEWPRAVVCVGTFDGVHLGHQRVIGRAVAEAASREAPAVLVTFDRHPAAVLAPERCPPALAGLGENLARFAELGVGVVLVLAFDYELSRTPAQQFLDEILVGKLHAVSAVVGHDFAMGQGRQGTAAWLCERLPTTVVPPLEVDGERVSSSRIRAALEAGEVGEARRLLGRPYALGGVVVPGRRLGRELGYPTANLARSRDQLVPADGVYAGHMRTGTDSYVAAISVGSRPAAGGGERAIEAYLLDYPGEPLYGRPVALYFAQRLRDQRDYPSLDALREQMARDVAAVRSSERPE